MNPPPTSTRDPSPTRPVPNTAIDSDRQSTISGSATNGQGRGPVAPVANAGIFSTTARHGSALSQFLGEYFWFTARNVVGWVFILGSLPVGLTMPGPFGLPLFLIGFMLVWFPGKRPLTTRVMSGRPVRFGPGVLGVLVVLVSVLVSALLIWMLEVRYEHLLEKFRLNIEVHRIKPLAVIGIVCLTAGVSWMVLHLALVVMNFLLRRVPRARRAMRPWLRRRGVTLLPSRHRVTRFAHGPPVSKGLKAPPRRRMDTPPSVPLNAPVAQLSAEADQTIVSFSPRFQRRWVGAWEFSKPWLLRLAILAIILWLLWLLGWSIGQKN